MRSFTAFRPDWEVIPTQFHMPIILYCDLDGVLHRWPCRAEEMFDVACIARLEEVIRPHNVGIVLTSTWRLEWPLAQIREQMGILGSRVLGVTPEIEDPFVRHGRYREVLQHRVQHALPDSNWIAIDDELGRYPEDLENLILTDPRTGFAAGDAVKLARLLGH